MFDRQTGLSELFAVTRLVFSEADDGMGKKTERAWNGGATDGDSGQVLHIGPLQTKRVRLQVRVEVVMKTLQMYLGLYEGIQAAKASDAAGGSKGGSYVDALLRGDLLDVALDTLRWANPMAWWDVLSGLNFRTALTAAGVCVCVCVCLCLCLCLCLCPC